MSVCDCFNVGRATAVRSVRRVVNALVSLREQFIKWPTEEKVVTSEREFRSKKGFPDVLGLIDGTHVKLDVPKNNADGYVNRKGYHSIQLQVWRCKYTLKGD